MTRFKMASPLERLEDALQLVIENMRPRGLIANCRSWPPRVFW